MEDETAVAPQWDFAVGSQTGELLPVQARLGVAAEPAPRSAGEPEPSQEAVVPFGREQHGSPSTRNVAEPPREGCAQDAPSIYAIARHGGGPGAPVRV